MSRKLIIVISLLLCSAIDLCGAQEIPQFYIQVAEEYDIPPVIFYSVALTESKKTIRPGVIRPWPWTLTVNKCSEETISVYGKQELKYLCKPEPHTYKSKQEAISALKTFLNEGHRNIDIGPMQINWKFNEHLLKTPELALEPLFNLRAGATKLRTEYVRSGGNWWTAVGYYHNPGASEHQRMWAHRYRKKVLSEAEKILKNEEAKEYDS